MLQLSAPCGGILGRGVSCLRARRRAAQQRRPEVTSSSFTHVSPEDASKPSMVDVSAKKVTMRQAVAEAVVQTAAAPQLVQYQKVLAAAAVTGAVNCYKTIPFCHPLDPVSVDLTLRVEEAPPRAVLSVTATTHGKTGVEMEALAGAAFAAVTAQTLCDAPCTITRVLLRHKTGGKSGSVHFDDNAELLSK
eukprot:TRINITY_DN13711_c0_g1_i1.p2 TRINITY_DN13711_c0_g1~~TRINITY_DN13711_c0_g1_i1.p2  ORF type:complete len:191 (+),score=63.05 TRINITY_DN13711_c0_g1_i1:64-636(+)